MNRCGIVAVVIDVNSAFVLGWHAFAITLVYRTGPLIVVYMAEENQIHLLTVEPKHVTIGSILSIFLRNNVARSTLNFWIFSVISYLVVEQEGLNGGNKVGIHVGQYTTMGGIHRSMPAMISEMPTVISCFLQNRFQNPEYSINNPRKKVPSHAAAFLSPPDQSLVRLLSGEKWVIHSPNEDHPWCSWSINRWQIFVHPIILLKQQSFFSENDFVFPRLKTEVEDVQVRSYIPALISPTTHAQWTSQWSERSLAL